MKPPEINSLIRIYSIMLLLLLGIAALTGGWELMNDTSGRSLGWTLDKLEGSPFEDYFIPGIFLFVFLGIISIAISILVFKKVKEYPILIISQGGILLIWIVIQAILIWEFNLLHLICISSGLFIIASGIFLLKGGK